MGLLGAIDLPGTVTAASVARACMRELLTAAGHQGVDEVELLVSELVTNAVRHTDSGRTACGVVRLVARDTGHAVRVEVIDQGSTGAIPQIPAQVDPLSESGRGLWLVRELSSAWGWEQDTTGRTIWFEVTG
ncbi:ATP-binding protein [Sphaerisporangium sp. NPDC088356]|uniref:ATP-binding protein n=1 Tax=unclassified Sphaerisporangium TaxID=2630420 RepID=UPI0034017DBD